MPFFNTYANSGTQWARNPTCWRYMDFLSLIAILQTKMLHFTNLNDLHKYDPSEGTGGLLIDVVNDPIRPRIIMVPSSAEVDAENAREIQWLKSELARPIAQQLPHYRQTVAGWDRDNRDVPHKLLAHERNRVRLHVARLRPVAIRVCDRDDCT